MPIEIDSRPIQGSPRQGVLVKLRAIQLAIVTVMVFALMGCGIIERVTGHAARKQAREAAAKAESQALQQKTMRFADEYMERVNRRTDALAEDAGYATVVAMYDWQLTQSTAAVQVAAGPNPIANALDMVVLVSLNRRIVESTWTDRYGEVAQPVLRTYQSLEQSAWRLLDGLVTEQQRVQLEEGLSQWFADKSDLQSAAFIRFADFAGVGRKAEVGISPGLLGIIGLDPLEGIDPAVREFEQTRMLFERAVYYAQRLPILLGLEVKLSFAQLRATSESQEVLAAVNRVGALSASVNELVAQTPDLVAREREAAIAQLMASLQDQEEDMRALTTELKGTLEAGTLTAQSLDTLVQSTDALVARFARDPTATAPSEPGRPFDINEYTRTVTELANTARELQALVRDVDTLTPELAVHVGQLTGEARELIDYVFLRVLLVILALLLAAVAYRLIASRLTRA